MKKVILSVTNDLVTDNRVHKVATSLLKIGFEVLLVGRKLPSSKPISKRNYETHRMNLWNKKGLFFYAEYNFRLFLFLLFHRADILLSNDLDTLPANYLAAKFRRKVLVYDSHEFFTEVPELIHRPKTKAAWEKIEKAILPKIQHAYTVCESIASVYHEKYDTAFKVVRNIPSKKGKVNVSVARNIRVDERKIILYQGALNVGRGLEFAIKSMQYLDDARLVIAGEGDISIPLRQLTVDLDLKDRATFLGKIPIDEMSYITAQADLGLSIEEDLGLNYRFALPNKLFDYIRQQIPVLVSNLPEMKKIVEDYQIGIILNSHQPRQMALQVHQALFDNKKRELWKTNLKTANKELRWENEEKVLIEIFEPLK